MNNNHHIRFMIFENININALVVTAGATIGCYYLYKKIIGSDPIYDASNTTVSVLNDAQLLSLKDMPIRTYIKNGLIVSTFVTLNYGLNSINVVIKDSHTQLFYIYNTEYSVSRLYDTNMLKSIFSIDSFLKCVSLSQIIDMLLHTERYILSGTALYVAGSIYYPILKIPLMGLVANTPVILYKILNQYISPKPLFTIKSNCNLVSPIIGIATGLLISELARSTGPYITYQSDNTDTYQNTKIVT